MNVSLEASEPRVALDVLGQEFHSWKRRDLTEKCYHIWQCWSEYVTTYDFSD